MPNRYSSFEIEIVPVIHGEGGIRTPGTRNCVHLLSRQTLSTAQPPLQIDIIIPKKPDK